MSARIFKLLVADDSEEDVILLRRSLTSARALSLVHHSPDGGDALQYLDGKPPYSNREEFPFPDLLLLDLKMPLVDGFEVLRRIAEHPPGTGLRVFVLSASNLARDIEQAQALGAAAYFVKPPTLTGLRTTMTEVEKRLLS